jgi:hypothetical protein
VLRTAGGVQVYEASLDMGGGSVRECSAVGLRDNSYGGGVQVHLESVAKLSDVEVVGCEARSERESFGGGVQVHSHGRLEMVGGSISDCAALSALDAVFGGGLQVASSAQALSGRHPACPPWDPTGGVVGPGQPERRDRSRQRRQLFPRPGVRRRGAGDFVGT